MKIFLKCFLATILGIIVSSILMVLIFIGIVSSMVSSSGKEELAIEKNSVLQITLDNSIADRGNDNPYADFSFTNMHPVKKLGLYDILENIKKAKKDDNIKGIYLDVSYIPAGISTIEEIRNALIDFRKSGKFILSYSELYTNGSYYLSTVADHVFINPEGYLPFMGLSVTSTFFKGALDKLGIEPEIIKHGKFKSAVEPFFLSKMSDENRLQVKTFVGSIWNHLTEGISKERKISVADLNKYADNLTIKDAEQAVKYNFIDSVKYKDEIITQLKKLSGIDKDNDLRLVTLSKYAKVPAKINDNSKISHNKIAVIFATGSIVSGDGDDNEIGSERISKAIRKARLDDNIKAIVLRVNSGGGSALASEIIWREMVLAKKVKPVIASFGDVAASGGYYIACAADTIVASPTTITGSIGVFGLFMNIEKFMSDKIGITTDRVTTNTYSDMGSPMRKMQPAERAVLQDGIEHIYNAFITHVAEGRRMTKSAVDSIGQGRVWDGVNAKKIGLIDVFGGMDTAIVIAANKAKLKDYRITILPEEEDTFTKIIKNLTGEDKSMIQRELGENYKYYQQVKQAIKYQGIQARLPFEYTIN